MYNWHIKFIDENSNSHEINISAKSWQSAFSIAEAMAEDMCENPVITYCCRTHKLEELKEF